MKNLPIYLLRKEEEGGTGVPPVIVTTGGRCFALLAPCSLRPSGHLRCASSPSPDVSVVSAQASGALRQPQRAWASSSIPRLLRSQLFSFLL